MISSRSLEVLHPTVKRMAQDFLQRCAADDIDLLVTCTFRDAEEQNRLYARGRTVLWENGAKVRKVTNAKAGQSFHNYRLALDVVPLRGGKPVWGTAGADGLLWQRVGAHGKAAGLEWAGDWLRFKEMAHFQFTGGHPLSYFQNGGTL